MNDHIFGWSRPDVSCQGAAILVLSRCFCFFMKIPLIARQHIWHIACCLLALLATLPLLWPRMLPRAWRGSAPEYAGDVILAAILVSLTVLILSSFFMLLRLRNLRTLIHCAVWASEWLLAAALFAVLAYFANVPLPPGDKESHVAQEETPSSLPPADILSGPQALVIPISPEPTSPVAIQAAPNLSFLESHHPDLLRVYVRKSPRWAASLSDQNFYSKPWHVVMVLQGEEVGPGFVHVAFLHLAPGEQLPSGYTVVKSGRSFPEPAESGAQLPDLALDLGGAHYLLLAWRGPTDSPHAHGALNAAIRTVDDMVRPLAKAPTPLTLAQLISGASHPEPSSPDAPVQPDVLLSEPYAQGGCYQAQIIANPGEPGTLVLKLVKAESGETLLSFEIPARYSHNPDELFLHNIPGDIPNHLRHTVLFDVVPQGAPVFIIRRGTDHQPHDVRLELYFRPAGRGMLYPILSKLYSVYPYSE